MSSPLLLKLAMIFANSKLLCVLALNTLFIVAPVEFNGDVSFQEVCSFWPVSPNAFQDDGNNTELHKFSNSVFQKINCADCTRPVLLDIYVVTVAEGPYYYNNVAERRKWRWKRESLSAKPDRGK